MKFFQLLLLSLATLSSAYGAPFTATDSTTFREIACRIVPRKRAKPPATAPYLALQESTSLNWSGYIAATSLTNPLASSVTNVSGSWSVPKIASATSTRYSAFWVGIDGFSSNTVEQIGTEHDWYDGSQFNYAWFEMYPKGAYEIVGFPLKVGDSISASVTYSGNNVFKLILTNTTQKVTTTIPSSYTTMSGTKRNSAEWIAEAPSNGYSVLPLANFGTVTFQNCQATIKGTTGAINNRNWIDDEIAMKTQQGVLKAQPSILNPAGTSFSVTWKHD